MVLEKLSGETLADILGSKRGGLQDIHYLRQALMQVKCFLNLLTAQSKSLGPGALRIY